MDPLASRTPTLFSVWLTFTARSISVGMFSFGLVYLDDMFSFGLVYLDDMFSFCLVYLDDMFSFGLVYLDDMFSFGLVYLDDNAGKSNSPFMLGLTFTFRLAK